MIIGIPREIKANEARVAMTPEGVKAARIHGHEVLVETSAGALSGFPDSDYENAGAKILPTADEVWGGAEMVVKVKEPLPDEFDRLREGLILFTYLHLAAVRELTEELMNKKVAAISYETIELDDG